VSEPLVITEVIPDALRGERVDRVVAIIADISRSKAVALIEAGGVTINGRDPDKPSVRVEPDTTIRIEVPEPDEGVQPDPGVEIAVVHVDEHVVVVEKQAHLVVHPGSGVRDSTLVNGLLAMFPEILNVGEPDRPGIVHRLDKGTSGLLMVARTAVAYESLGRQLAMRTVQRVYQSVVHGLVEAESGLIDAPLGRSPRDATRRAVVADGRPARTRYEVLDRLVGADCSQVACRLETGRTHQIRAHLSAIGHPVVGDERYGGTSTAGLDRPFLHAAQLGFEHPESGELLHFESALPDDLSAALEQLRQIPVPAPDPGE
jgi:23S rRNA pseudouridine1911/1915/1917 synthase